MKSDAERAADYINRCTAAVAKIIPVNGKWNLKLPEPSDDVEHEALRLFLAEFEDAIGMPKARGNMQ